MWGWTVDKSICFQLLDQFYQAGLRQVDAATNYPINRNPEDFRAAENILLEWINAHGIQDLQVIMKVGSVNNLYTPEHNLQKSFLLFNLDDYHHRLGSNLHTLMIHWDNREEPAAIRQSLEALEMTVSMGVQAGLSGIRHPDIYAVLNREFHLRYRIEIKHNLFYSDYPRYAPLHDAAEFLAYGINAAGLKLTGETSGSQNTFTTRGGKLPDQSLLEKLQNFVRQWNTAEVPVPLSRFNQIALIHSWYNPGISGILIGPSQSEQLQESLQFCDYLRAGHYHSVYADLSLWQQS